MFFFQMPKLPEFFVRMNDLKTFDVALGKFSTPEEVEAYKYTFSKKGDVLILFLYQNRKFMNKFYDISGAITPPINYYRANFATSKWTPKPAKDIQPVPGLYLLGEEDLFISKKTGELLQKSFNNLEFKFVPGAGHFAQQDKPDLVNKLMREFLEKK